HGDGVCWTCVQEYGRKFMANSRKRPWYRRRAAGLITVLVLLGGVVALVLPAGSLNGREANRITRNIGNDRLVAFAPLPETEGPMCELQPASATSTLMEALAAQQATSGAAEARPTDAARTDASKRPPAHVMRDPSAAFSGVAIDLKNDE